MDNSNNLNKTSETESRSPLKELNKKNNKPPEPCDIENKNAHLFDMESSFLQNSVMLPAEFDPNQNGKPDGTNNSNQENQKPRYSILNTIKKETDELSCNDNHLNANVFNKSAEFSNASKTFVNPITEDLVEISAAVSDTLGIELNKSSVSNISTQSDNSILNNTVILNKSLTVKNITPETSFTDANESLDVSSPVKPSEENLTTADQNFVKGNSNISLNLTPTLDPSKISLPDVRISEYLNTPDSNVSLNKSSTLKPDVSIEGDSITSSDQTCYTAYRGIVDDISLSVSLASTPKTDEENYVIRLQDITNSIDHLKLSDIGSGIVSPTADDTIDDSFLDAFATKLEFSSIVEADKSVIKYTDTNEEITNEGIEIKDVNNDALISNDKVETAANESIVEAILDLDNKCEINGSELPTDITKISGERSIDTVIYINDLIEDLSQIPAAEKVPVEINEASETVTNNDISDEIDTSTSQIPEALEISTKKDISAEINSSYSEVNEAPEPTAYKNISIEINTSNSQVTEELSKTLTKENINESFQNKDVSFEVDITSPQIGEEAPNEISKEESCPTQSLNTTYDNNSVADTIENVISSSISVEETHMSASEPNSGLNEPTVANRVSLETNAACTNEMGELINQNEYFEKQSDITNGDIDNKEALEAKARVYKEMAEKYSVIEAECEKLKVQVSDLKKELKTCRQKTVALETEVADLKRRENELNVLLEEYKLTAANKGDGNDDDEQLHRLQANEDTLKKEVKELNTLLNQHESRLKELQRKEVKLADDLTSKTQSEMQISRVMEEYEKSISSLISDNEKMKKERDTAQMHLANIEMAFSDVHQKYERCKAIVQGYKDNEESYKQDIAMNRETIVIQEQKYESLKAHAMNQLEKSNQELATMKKQHETEMARLTAQLKRYEIKNQSLVESLQQKAKECEQLSAVCDEFIGIK